MMTNDGPFRKVGLASDEFGQLLKEQLLDILAKGQRCRSALDFGTFPAPESQCEDAGDSLAEAISSQEIDGGVFIGRAAQSVAIFANKIPSIRAVVVLSPFEAELARRHFDTNLLCLWDFAADAERILSVWLMTPFEKRHSERLSRHARRVAKITALEKSLLEASDNRQVLSEVAPQEH